MSRDRASRSSANAEMLRFDDHDAKRKRISGKIRAAAIARRISRIVSARDCTHRPLETHCRVVLAQFEPEHYWLRRVLTRHTPDRMGTPPSAPQFGQPRVGSATLSPKPPVVYEI